MVKIVQENLEGKYSDKFKSLAKKYFFEDDASSLKALVDDLIRYTKEEDLKDLWFDRDYGRMMPDPEEECLSEGADDFDYESDFDDGEVSAGVTFIEDGVEYEYVQSYGDPVSLDFDTWQVWEAVDTDADEDNVESKFFVVEVDTGFIDWGPVDSAEEAKEFLASKVEEWEDDDDDTTLDDIIYN